MTCIIGVYDPKKKKSYLVGDRAVSMGSSVETLPYPKIIQSSECPSLVVGVAGYLRGINIIQKYVDALIEPNEILKKVPLDLNFMIDCLAPRLKEIFIAEGAEDVLKESLFLVGTPEGIFKIDPLLSVLPYNGETEENFCAIGSGADMAKACLRFAKKNKCKVDEEGFEIIMDIVALGDKGVSLPVDILETEEE